MRRPTVRHHRSNSQDEQTIRSTRQDFQDSLKMKTVQRFIGKACMLAATLGLTAFGATSASAANATAVEYHYSGHYFMTAFPDEILAIDSGAAGGWKRTGYSFKVQDQPLGGYRSVCRFYLTGASRGSHFYTADAAECAELKTDLDWKYEAVAFSVPSRSSDGSCLSGQVPVYRLYNNRLSGVPNHRYTTCSGIRDSMVSSGWVAEGEAMCVTAASSDCGYPVVDTGQTKTFSTSIEIAAPGSGQTFYGQDAQFAGTQPSYTKSNDGLTVKDNVTGLTWQQSQTAGDIYWTDAEAVPVALNKASYGGYSDWRLPTIRELYSIWNASKGWPYIDTNYFTVSYTSQTDLSHAIMWSSTKYTGLLRSSIEGNVGAEMAFGVNFGTGHIKAYSTSVGPKHMVRAVRGPIYGTSSFVDNGNGTINDQATGLMWTQSDSGVGMDWEHALAWAQTKNGEKLLGYSDWRLPNSKELQSLVDYTRSAEATSAANVGPAISPLFNTSSITNEAGATDYPYFWTNTSAGGKDGEPLVFAWYVAFGRAADASGKDLHGAGAIRFDAKVTGKPQGQDAERVFNYVRLVRGTTD
jgi:hypothetical protein